jgi:hypothetical protein
MSEDWETKYWDILGLYALEKAEWSRKREKAEVEDEEDDSEEGRFVDQIAPVSSDLPAIMTMATPIERQVIIAEVKARIVDGLWTGTIIKKRKDGSGGRPFFARATTRSKEEQRSGKRKQKLYPNKQGRLYMASPTVTFTPSHCVLIDAGYYPTEERNVASHICHKSECLLAEHLEWSSSSDNNRRERKCRKTGECRCGLATKCIFGAHE